MLAFRGLSFRSPYFKICQHPYIPPPPPQRELFVKFNAYYVVSVLSSEIISNCTQGNPPLDIPTRESREKNWSKKKPLEFYIFADNVNDRTRSDAAIFYVSHCSILAAGIINLIGCVLATV
jgi:hypothetical protein